PGRYYGVTKAPTPLVQSRPLSRRTLTVTFVPFGWRRSSRRPAGEARTVILRTAPPCSVNAPERPSATWPARRATRPRQLPVVRQVTTTCRVWSARSRRSISDASTSLGGLRVDGTVCGGVTGPGGTIVGLGPDCVGAGAGGAGG